MLTLLRRARLYDPDPRGVVDVLVAGGRVAAIGALPSAPSGWPVEEIDLDGAIVVPGLVDAHTHLAGGGGEGGAHTRVPAVGLSQLTLAGVTTAIGLLGTDGTTRTVAELLAVARGLTHLGIEALCYTGSYEVPPVTLTGSVRGDIVHVDRIVAVGEVAISDHRSSQPTFDEIVRLAADAHVAGMMTGKAGLLHLHLGDGARGLDLIRRALDTTELPPRVFHPTHLNRNPRLWAEAKDLSQLGIYCDITAFPPDDDGPWAGDALVDWLASGLDPDRLTMSSDGGGCLPVFDAEGVLTGMDVGKSAALLDAIRGAVDRGAPLERALATVTRNPARLFRLRGRGEVVKGSCADLVVLDDALRVRATMARGRWLVRDGRPLAHGPFEARGAAPAP